MHLGKFQLERYGPFDELDLPFDPTPGRVNLIVAPNGYGKSVIRRAIGEFLFGIEARTPMTFRFGTERMFLKAEVTHDGATNALVRRKGNGNTLAHADGREVPPAEFQRLLGGGNDRLFQELFGLDTTLLRSGGQDLIRSQGRLGQVLFAAGGGMGRVRDLLTELARKRDELGRADRRHRSRPIWSALSNWEQSNIDLRRTALRPDGWTALEHQASEATSHLQILLTQQAEDTSERDRLRTIGACRPWLERLQTARQSLADAADAPELDETFEKRWREALVERATSAASVNDAANALQSAKDARSALAFDPAWIQAEADITALAILRGQALGAERDLPKVESDLAADRANAATLRQDLGWSADFPLPPAPIVKDAQRRLREHPKLAVDAASAHDRLAEANRQLDATLAELETLPGHNDVATINDLAGLLRANGDPATRLDNARRKLRETEAALRAALSAIPDHPLSESALGLTAAPSETRLEAAGKALTEAEAAHALTVRDHATQQRTVDTERAKLAALERAAMLPPPDALANARAHRDALWAHLCQPAPEQPAAATAVALDRAIRDADTIADALIAHGRDVAEATSMRDRLTNLETEHTQHAHAVTQAAAAVAQTRNDLLAIARAAGGNAETLSSLRAFLGTRQAAILCRDARDAAAADLTDVENTLATLGARLAKAMTMDAPDLLALGTLLGEADRRIEADRNLAAHRKTLAEQAMKQRAARAAATTVSTKADRGLADWVTQWQPVSTALGRPTGEPTATTADALTRIEDLRATEHRAADNQRRVNDMHASIALLTSEIDRLSALSPDYAALSPIEAADAFQRRLQTELQQAIRCADADRGFQQAADKHTQCLTAAETAAHTLTGLRAALRAETDDDAEHQLQRSRAAAAARAISAEAQRELAIQGGGLSIETLAARAAETTADADMARIAAIDLGQQDRAQLIDAARTSKDAATTALDQAGTSESAADAAQRREAAQAALSRTAEEALILHATHALLQTALDRQAAGASQPLLNRISEIFRTITNGAQAGVHIEDSRDGQTMVALESDGATRKSLEQLSEGTCDQLYLALRIAALEDYAAATSPLPFIADDILQTFDDPRTIATLRSLVALSAHVQVIILTHHRHVGELAAGLPGDTVQVIPIAA
jgi:uncharacterized protein YhaN